MKSGEKEQVEKEQAMGDWVLVWSQKKNNLSEANTIKGQKIVLLWH